MYTLRLQLMLCPIHSELQDNVAKVNLASLVQEHDA